MLQNVLFYSSMHAEKNKPLLLFSATGKRNRRSLHGNLHEVQHAVLAHAGEVVYHFEHHAPRGTAHARQPRDQYLTRTDR